MDSRFMVLWVLATVVAVYGSARIFRWCMERYFPREATEGERVMALAAAAAEMTVPTGAAPGTLMEEREKSVRDRLAAGKCVHCNEPATHQMPTLRIVRSWFDPLLRYLGVKSLDRWRIVVFRGIENPFALCAKHQERARGLLERKVSEVTAEYAEFADKQRKGIYEFEVCSLYATMEADMEELRSGNGKRRRQSRVPGAVVQPLPMRKAGPRAVNDAS